jgi:hypothetical protein
MATPPKKANARAGVRMRKSFDDKCTLTTVVNSPREFKGSPAMFASRPRISGLEPDSGLLLAIRGPVRPAAVAD